MPPEQALAKWDEVGPHSDIYSAGATLFNLLSGVLAHEGTSAPQLLVAVATRPARPLRSVAPHVPDALAAVIDRALAHDASGRWPSAAAMRDALSAIDSSAGALAAVTPRRSVALPIANVRATPEASAPTLLSPGLPGHPTTSPVSADQPMDVATLIPTDERPRKSSGIAIFAIGVVGAMLATGMVGWWAIGGRSRSASNHEITSRTSERAASSAEEDDSRIRCNPHGAAALHHAGDRADERRRDRSDGGSARQQLGHRENESSARGAGAAACNDSAPQAEARPRSDAKRLRGASSRHRCGQRKHGVGTTSKAPRQACINRRRAGS